MSKISHQSIAGIIPALCFKQLFHIGVWTFAWFVRPLLATILYGWEICSGSNNRIFMYHVFHQLAPNKINSLEADHSDPNMFINNKSS